MKISPLGDSALTLDFADESSDRARLLARTLSAAERLEGANLPGVVDVTCAYESVAVFFDPARIEQDFEDKIGALVSSAGIRALRKARKIEIPVCYDDEFALDLERVASQTFLTGDAIISITFIDRIHGSLHWIRPWLPFSRRAVGQVACATVGKPANESSRWFGRDRQRSSWHLSI